jgi:hypothetical protein
MPTKAANNSAHFIDRLDDLTDIVIASWKIDVAGMGETVVQLMIRVRLLFLHPPFH